MNSYNLTDILRAFGYTPEQYAWWIKPPACFALHCIPRDLADRIVADSQGALTLWKPDETRATVMSHYAAEQAIRAHLDHERMSKVRRLVAAIKLDPIAGTMLAGDRQKMLAEKIVNENNVERAKRYGVEL